MSEDVLRSKMAEVFVRTQRGFKTNFESVTVNCGSWKSVYQYIMGENGEAKDINALSARLKDMDSIECMEDGGGRVVVHIGTGILKDNECQS